MDVEHYLTPHGADPFQEWFDELEDMKGRIAILRRIDRMAIGNFGDHKYGREGVWELRLDVGPGYRIYYSRQGDRLLVLLGGGSKRTQTADINNAVAHLSDYRRRKRCLENPKTR